MDSLKSENANTTHEIAQHKWNRYANDFPFHLNISMNFFLIFFPLISIQFISLSLCLSLSYSPDFFEFDEFCFI